MKKKIFFYGLAAFALIQFIRPAKNHSSILAVNDITRRFPIPDSVFHLLQRSCYDCHSDNTVYPWYDNIQPVGWWLQYHVNHGKHGLNFSAFLSYTPTKQAHKLKNISQEIRDGGMPLDSYLWIHRYAIMRPEDKALVMHWADSLRATIDTSSRQ